MYVFVFHRMLKCHLTRVNIYGTGCCFFWMFWRVGEIVDICVKVRVFIVIEEGLGKQCVEAADDDVVPVPYDCIR